MSLRAKSTFQDRQRRRAWSRSRECALGWHLPLPVLPEAKQENSKQKGEEPCKYHMFGGIIIWKNNFSPFLNIYRNIQEVFSMVIMHL